MSNSSPSSARRLTNPRIADSWRGDVLSGFIVFLIALPLCLAIASTSNIPAIAGVFTAIVGGVAGFVFSNAQLAIKGPAAGLIPIVSGAMAAGMLVAEGNGVPEAERAMAAYHMVLAIGIAAAAMQIAFALLRVGVLGDLFPSSAVHGMLAAIGLIIISKQIPVMLGGEAGQLPPLELLYNVPRFVRDMNPAVGLIGLTSLAIMFGLPAVKRRWNNRVLNVVPAPLVVLLVAVPLGLYFHMNGTSVETVQVFGRSAEVAPKHLISVPLHFLAAVATPDFSILQHAAAWYWVMMFALIGTLESMLSAKAVDMIDPWRRKTSLNRDVLAVGVGNAAAAAIGGLPMISEIVRSRANTDAGARTKLSNLCHGMFLLAFAALLPGLINHIPKASLAAMLIFTGWRLASPQEFQLTYKLGKEQFLIFVTTIIMTLQTDLLWGVASGIALKVAIHCINGAPVTALLKPNLVLNEYDDETQVVTVYKAAVFSNWLLIKKQIQSLESRRVLLDLSETRLVDHTVMERLHELEGEFERSGRELLITGLEDHRALSGHPLAARKKNPGLVDAPLQTSGKE